MQAQSVADRHTFNVTPEKAVSSLTSLEALQQEASLQIANLLLQKRKLGDISTQVNNLITRYNAQKSYLGYAAQWYGEQVWWLQIALSTVATGIAIILYVPTIISIALSLAASFLLINHHQVSQERDRLISRDLNSQNNAVQTMLTELETAKKKLEENLEVLCKLNQDMCNDNIKLRNTVATVTEKSKEFESRIESQAQQILTLQDNEQLLSQQLKDLEIQFTQYKDMLEESAKAFVQNNQEFGKATAQMTVDSVELRNVTANIVSSTTRSYSNTSSLNSSPDGNQAKLALEQADAKLSKPIVDEKYMEELEKQVQLYSPVVTPVKHGNNQIN